MRRCGRRCGAAALVAVVVLASVLVGVLAVGPAGASDRPPTKWDPRVREFVRFVEKTRRLEFDHPITVEFLDDAAFRERVVRDDADLTKEDRALNRRYSGDLYALGLAGPDFDYQDAANQLDAAGVVGYYDQDTGRMVVRGQDLTDTDVRVTVVHELTHALQDQEFGLTKLQRATKSSGADFALGALIEGDATWVGEEYVASLPQAEQDAYAASFESSTGSSGGSSTGPSSPETASAASVSPVLDFLFAAPYGLGYWFVDSLRNAGGAEAVDSAMQRPPPSDEQIIDPVAFLHGERPKPPRAPRLRPGEAKRGGSDELGVLGLYVVLASRLDPRTALAAVTGWRGDTSVGFTRDERPCLRAAIVMDDRAEGVQLSKALQAWAGRGPTGAASVRRDGDRVTLEACGAPDATLPSEQALTDAADALGTRILNYEAFEQSKGLTPRDVRCLADLYSTDRELRDLFATVAPEDVTPAQQALIDRRAREYGGTCGLEIAR